MSKILQLRKDTSTEVGKMHLYLDGLKQEGVKIFNKLFKQVDSINSKANSSHKELVILVQKSYSNFFKNMERSYERFRHNIHNILI